MTTRDLFGVGVRLIGLWIAIRSGVDLLGRFLGFVMEQTRLRFIEDTPWGSSYHMYWLEFIALQLAYIIVGVLIVLWADKIVSLAYRKAPVTQD